MSRPERGPIEGLTLEQASLVDELCDAFEGSWRHGERLPMERFLVRVPEGASRAVLFRELLGLELELRAEAGEAPTGSEYLRRFPDRADQIRAQMDEDPRVAAGFGKEQTAPLGDHEVSTRTQDDQTLFTLQAGGLERLDAGSWVGPYQILERIGAGGMGVVYRAWQKGADRYVALKLIRPRWGHDSTESDSSRAEKMFLREARAAAQLNHEAIATIHDVGQDAGRYYYSMQLIDGMSLAERLRSGPLSPRHAAEILRPVSRAIAHAHARGIVHRDMKPGNILLDRDDRPYVVDFGLAKLMEADQEISDPGARKGTLFYMPPEQARGDETLGPAADIYSLGATLYEAITGRPPFRTARPTATVDQILFSEPVSPRRLNAAVPRDLETICLACLEKKPQDRYATAAALADELDRFLEYRPLKRRRPWIWERLARQMRRRPLTSAIAATVALTLMGLIALLVGSRWRERATVGRLAGALVAAPLDGVVTLSRAIEPYGARGRAEVAELLRATRPAPPDLTLKAGLILVRDDPRWARYLAQRMLDESVVDHRVIREALGATSELTTRAAALFHAVLEDGDEPRDRRIRAASGLIGLSPRIEAGRAARAWAMLAHGPDDTSRSLLIDWLERTATPAEILLDRLDSEPDASIRRALIQALGRPDAASTRTGLDGRVLAVLWDLYRRDPDPGVHGSLAALFRSRGLGSEVDRVDRSIGPPPGASWFVNRLGQTCVRVAGREAGEREAPGPAIRPFAVALTKTTVGQYLELMPGPDGLGLFRHANGCARPDDLRPELPISCVSYIDAIAFCRRLSELDGMSEDRMCYPPPDRIKLGMTPPDDAPTRTGWRLPTIDEWEYLARAGTVTDTFWGTDESIAPRYGWFGQPIGTRLKPIGWYRPNDLGINELFGNVYEWCSLPPDRDDAVCHLQPHGKQECDCGPLIAFRGGSLTTPPVYFKANPPVGRMNGMRTTISFEGTGFRIVRTLTPEEARTGPFAVISSVIPTPR